MKGEDELSKEDAPDGFPRTEFHWQRELDAYIADMHFPCGVKKDRPLYQNLLEVHLLS